MRRFSRLDLLESAVYGAVLGVVIGSTALIPLASWLGLRVPVLIGLGAVSAGIGYALLRGRSSAEPAPGGAAIGRGALVVLALFILRWAWFGTSALTVDAQGLHSGHTHIWGDWSQHLGDVTSFAYGDNFPPTHPRFAGHPLSYHYLTSVTVAAMVRFGMTPIQALPFHSFVFLSLLTLGLFAFARRLSGDSTAAALATVLFLIGGGLGWGLSVRDALATSHPLQALWAHPWNRAAQEAANFRWKDIVFAYLVPQRAVLYGLPLGMVATTLLLEGGKEGGWRPFVLAGIATGLLPLAHLGTMLALALITPFLVLAFPRRGWVAYFAVWAALSEPVFLSQQGGGGALRFIHLQIGWIAKPDPWWFFWLKNLGAFVPLLVWALFDRDALPRAHARFLWAFIPVFVIANLVVFQPWDWDNTKVFLYWYLAGCVFVGASLVRMVRREGVVVKIAAATLVATLIFSGLLAQLDQALGHDRLLMLTAREMEVAQAVREQTPPHALFLAGLQHNHPVAMLGGRRVVMSYPGWMWSQGIDASQREKDVRAMYALSPEGVEKMAELRVNDVVIGPWERDHFHPDEAAFAARFRRVIDMPPYAVYEVR